MCSYILPTGWKQKTVKELCGKPQYGHTASAETLRVGPKFLRITDIQNGNVDWETVPYCTCNEVEKYRLRNGDILFARTGATTGKSYIVKDAPEAIFASYLIRISPSKEVIPEFLYQYFQSPNYWWDVCAGTEDGNRPNMNGTKLGRLTISYPEDVNEQRRIVARIEELTRRADEARQLITDSKSSFESILSAYLQRLMTVCEKRSWSHSHLGDKSIARLIMGQSPPGSSYNREERGIPLLNGPTEFGKSHPSPVQWTTDSKRECRKGDILFCVRGSTTGRMNWADQEYSIGRGIAAIRVNEKKMSPAFVYGMIQIQVTEILHKAEGGVFPNFNKDQLSSLLIPVPSFPDQEAFVQEIKALEDLRNEVSSLKKDVEKEISQLTPSVLAKAFRGEL